MNEVGQVMTKEELIEKLNQVRNLVNDRVNNLETSKLEQDINDLEAKLANDNLLVDDGRLNLLEELYNEAKTEEQNNLISLKRKDDIVNAIINDNKKLEAEISALTSVNNQMVDHLTINKEKIGDSELEHLNSMIIRNEETINRNKLSILGNNDLISRYNGFQVDLESRKDKLAFITNEHREALNNHKIELNRIQQERNNERIKNAETLKELKTKYTQNQMLKREATTINFKISDLITGLENNTVSIEQAMREVEILRAGYNKAQLNDGNLGLQRTDRYRYNPRSEERRVGKGFRLTLRFWGSACG